MGLFVFLWWAGVVSSACFLFFLVVYFLWSLGVLCGVHGEVGGEVGEGVGVDGVGLVEDGVDAYSFLEDEGCVVKGLEKGSYGEGGVVLGVATVWSWGDLVAAH